MKFGAFINILQTEHHNDWTEQFDFIHSFSTTSKKADHVELWLECAPTAADISFIRGKANELSLELIMHAPFIGVMLASHDAAIRKASIERIIAASKVAEQLNVKSVTCHTGAIGHWLQKEEALELIINSFKQIVTASSVPITIENMPTRKGGSYEPVISYKDLAYILNNCPNLYATLDVGHCIQNAESPEEAFMALKQHVLDIHLHDGFVHGAAHKRIGSAELDTAKFLDTLTQENYTNYLTLETIGYEDTAASWQSVYSMRN